ncbi:unnamed protein product, partial [Pylaiella littoralis]
MGLSLLLLLLLLLLLPSPLLQLLLPVDGVLSTSSVLQACSREPIRMVRQALKPVSSRDQLVPRSPNQQQQQQQHPQPSCDSSVEAREEEAVVIDVTQHVNLAASSTGGKDWPLDADTGSAASGSDGVDDEDVADDLDTEFNEVMGAVETDLTGARAEAPVDPASSSGDEDDDSQSMQAT